VSAFTLEELVVVIGIISLLFSMLLPALSMARAKARGAVCVSNLRQMAMAMEEYRENYDDYIPKVLQKVAFRDMGESWSLLPNAYAVVVEEPASAGSSAASSLERFVRDPRVLQCPELAGRPGNSYGLNGQVIDYVNKFRMVPNPAEVPLAFDSDQPVGRYYSDLSNRHVGCANILYTDFHVAQQYYDTLFSFSSAAPLAGVGVHDSDLFTLATGTVTAHSAKKADARLLGGGFGYITPYGIVPIPIRVYYQINNNTPVLVSNDANANPCGLTLPPLQPGDKINIIGQRSDNGWTFKGGDGSGHVWVLGHGDTVPTISGCAGESSIKEVLSAYVTSDGKVNIGEDSVIYLFEFSQNTDYTRYTNADFQDTVVLVQFSRQ